MTSFGPHWPSACEPVPADELLAQIAVDRGITLTADQALGLLRLVDGVIAHAVLLLDDMIAAHNRRHGSRP